MCNDIRVTKQEVRDFLLINFGMIAFLSIFIFINFFKSNNVDIIPNFARTFMYIPAFSAIVVLKRNQTYEFNNTVIKFFEIFIIATILKIVFSIFNVSIINGFINSILSCYTLYYGIKNFSEFKVLNLQLNKNFKEVLFCILLYLVICIIEYFPEVSSLKFEINSFIGNSATVLLSLLENLVFGCIIFFGEEFGWRYFLQPRLQKLYGKRWGVIVLGPIWGIWHLPLCMTLYSPQTPVYCIVNHLFLCTTLGVFLGYAYMKTENLWTPILIHLITNVFSVVFSFLSSGELEAVFTLRILLYSVLWNSVLYLPFLFAKVYRPNKDDIGVSIDN